MSTTTILSVIQHYQRSIEHSQDEGRLLHCINKLYRLPVKVEHLQETGVGKTVNSLRKYNGEIGVAAKALVTKWKAMVAAEEEPTEANNCENNDDNDDDGDDGNNGNDHGSGDDDHCDTKSHNNNKKSSITTTSESTSKERQSNNITHNKKSNSENHKSKSHREEKSNKHSHTEHSSSKHKRHGDQEENGVQNEKRIKNGEHSDENKKRDNHKHKTSHQKGDRQHAEDEKEPSSNKDAKTSSSKQISHHHRNGGDSDSKEKKENSQHKDEKRKEHASSSKHKSNENEEVAIRNNSESEKKRSSSKEKDRKERTKESKHDKSKSSSKDSSHRDKHHKSSSKLSTTAEQPTSSSSNIKPDSTSGSSSSKRKRHHDSDSNDATSPSKSKAAKTSKSPTKQKMTPTNDNENDGDDDGIDSSMGANFADVLGMLMMPTKKSKKLLSNNKSPTISTPSRNISTEKPSSSNNTTYKDNRNEYKPSSISSSTSFKPVDTKPELLSSSTKLDPLDPSIALELPTISPNYKPLPTNKIVMECIYRNSGIVNSAPKPPVRTFTDAEAISHGISSKTMRTKIYSGIKTGQMLQVPLLFDLCIRVLQKNIDALEYTGGVPFDVLRPVLERATPLQLLTFEEYNPYLMEDSDCLWQIHVQRSFRSKKREEMESWREMYLRCEDEKERKLSSLMETIKNSQKIITAPIRKTQLAFVDSMVKPPRNVLRKQEQFGTKEKLVATPASRVAALSNVTPNAVKVGDTRLRVAATVRDTAQVVANPARGKKAPLMAKTLQFIRGRHKR
ncbi:transcription elongation factor B polypeptide 3 [Eurosta solidaginis]|uniref:transcription elongation factor B polypeptide 3 n=1 Tax=Eurosta solidaginis TaxID=178769 RepID=UPI003530EE8A